MRRREGRTHVWEVAFFRPADIRELQIPTEGQGSPISTVRRALGGLFP